MFKLCSDYLDCPRTVLGVHSDYVGEGKVLERSQGIRWTSSRWHLSSHSDGECRDNDGRDDGDEDKDMVKEDKDGDKEEKDEPPFCDSEIPGISNWDLLGKDFECEAAALCLYSLY